MQDGSKRKQLNCLITILTTSSTSDQWGPRNPPAPRSVIALKNVITTN